MKKLILLALVICLMFSMSSCLSLMLFSGSDDTKPAETKQAETKPADTASTAENNSGNDVSLLDFVGMWKYDEKEVYVTVFDNATWIIEGSDADEDIAGDCRMEGDGMLVISTYGKSDVNFFRFNEDGTIYDSVYFNLSRYAYDGPDKSVLVPFIGRWSYTESGKFLVIDAGGGWESYDSDMHMENFGTYRYDEQFGLVLEAGENDVDYLKFDKQGELFNSTFENLVLVNE